MLVFISVLFRMWEMVLKMSNEIVAPNSGADGAKHRTSVAISKAIIGRAKAYLESAFLKFVKNTVFANLQKAQLGGVPGTYHLVRSFLNVKISPHTPGLEDGLVDGEIFLRISKWDIKIKESNKYLQPIFISRSCVLNLDWCLDSFLLCFFVYSLFNF